MQANKHKVHFTSWHGLWGGIISAASIGVLAVGGVAFRKLGVLQRFPVPVQTAIKTGHRLSGPLVWVAAMGNMLLGLMTHGAGPHVTLHWIQGALIVVMMIAQGILYLQPQVAVDASAPDAGKLV
jgi:hypothetical protein